MVIFSSFVNVNKRHWDAQNLSIKLSLNSIILYSLLFCTGKSLSEALVFAEYHCLFHMLVQKYFDHAQIFLTMLNIF